MCGIWAIFGVDKGLIGYNKIHHRGPDAWRIENDSQFKNCCLGFHRLAIVDNTAGMQPMRLKTHPHLWLICNGEIFNHRRLQNEFDFEYKTSCDVESIIHLYAQGRGIEHCAAHLDGVFAFCLLDTDKRKVFVVRDTFGVRPAFKLQDKSGFLAVCSEAKGLIDLSKGLNGNSSIEPVPPGHCLEYDLHEDGHVSFVRSKRFHSIGDLPKYELFIPQKALDENDFYANIRTLFIGAVEKRLMSERRIGCLLSGGLDSSLAAAVLLKLAKEMKLPYPVQTFAIGIGEDSPDILAAQKVAKHIGSEHYEVIVTSKQILDALDTVVYHLESYDITTVRASVCMYLLSQYISENTDTTVIFSGEGSDELAQGYIYFRDAPSADEGDSDSRRLLKDLYLYDVLRSDRTTAAHGLEMRVPFLDHQFTSYYLSLPKELRQPKKGVEKHLLRQAFEGTDLLPNDILWRHKEAFSDGVASCKNSLFVLLQEYAETRVTDKDITLASSRYPHNTPRTKESFYYRRTFEEFYPGQQHWIPYFWMPKWTDATDPSARFLKHYAADQSNDITH